MTLSPLHALGVFRAGLECSVLNRLWHLIWTHAVWARAAFSLWDWAAWALAASGLAVLARGVLPDEAPPSDAPVFAASIFFLGYLPYVFDATYTPAIFSATNRVNFTASAGAALLAAWALRRAFASARPASRAAGAAIAAVLPAALLLSTWVSNAQWAEAATRQGKIISGLNRKLDALPPGKKTILLFDLETFVGSAPVFNSTYDLDGALSYVRRDPDLRALVAEGRVSFGEKNATMNWFGATEISYEGLYAYRANAGLIARIANKADGETFLNAR